METWIPNSDREIIKLTGLYSTQREYWTTRLTKTTGLYNVDESYIIYITDNIPTSLETALTNNRYLFSSKVTFEIPVLYIKATMNPSGASSAQYGMYVTPKIKSITFVENRATKQYHFKLEIKHTYELYNPGAGSGTTNYRFDVKGFKNPSVSLNLIETKEYYYETFTFNSKEISFSKSLSTDPLISTSQDSDYSDTKSLPEWSPLTMGDDSAINFPSKLSRLTKFFNVFRRKDSKHGNMK